MRTPSTPPSIAFRSTGQSLPVPRITSCPTLFPLSASACLLTALLGCADAPPPLDVTGTPVKPPSTKPARRVAVAPAERKKLEFTVDTVGHLEAEQVSSIAAGVIGIVDEVRFREGDWVDPEKSILVTVDQTRYKMAVALAKAALAKASADSALAEDALARVRKLRERDPKFVTEDEFALKRLQLEAAKALREEASLAVRLAEKRQADSRVRPPFKGQVDQRLVAPGDWVKEETVVATMADVSSLRLVTNIPESAAAQVKIGQLIRFEPRSLPGREFAAKVFFLSSVADAETQLVQCKARVEKPDPTLRPGFFARVKVPVGSRAGAVVVPEEAVRPTEHGFVAFVPVPATANGAAFVAQRRTLQLGFRQPGRVEVLSGLQPGETVVTRGADLLDEGTPLEIVEGTVNPIPRPPLSPGESAGVRPHRDAGAGN